MSLVTHLRDQHGCLDELIGLLGRERDLLGEGRIDGEALGAVATEKQQILAALADFETRRREVHARLGYSQDVAGDERAAREQDCLALWRQMRGRARQAAQLNHFNGQLINIRLTSNQRLLNDLRMLAGKDLYGPDGQARGGDSRIASQA
ncbi:MAG TPA: flagellar protein FlgN [Rhodanobacteraceae bacterium]|nr:flagellar protein FlgN [Rhodanobacteraceae bacterium]